MTGYVKLSSVDEDLLAKKQGKQKFGRVLSALVVALGVIAGIYISDHQKTQIEPTYQEGSSTRIESTRDEIVQKNTNAGDALELLAVKGRAPKTGYTRSQFGAGWQTNGGCDTRNRILARDLTDVIYDINSCIVTNGTLHDPYTGKIINFLRGPSTSSKVQIDHVVALSDAWQKGAQQLTPELRIQLANDGLNLLAVDGAANQNKSDGDAATWLPSYKPFRCAYVARQIAVKVKYSLWMTVAEKTATEKILESCPDQKLTN